MWELEKLYSTAFGWPSLHAGSSSQTQMTVFWIWSWSCSWSSKWSWCLCLGLARFLCNSPVGSVCRGTDLQFSPTLSEGIETTRTAKHPAKRKIMAPNEVVVLMRLGFGGYLAMALQISRSFGNLGFECDWENCGQQTPCQQRHVSFLHVCCDNVSSPPTTYKQFAIHPTLPEVTPPNGDTHAHTLDKSRRRDTMFPQSLEVLISMWEVIVYGLPLAMYFQTWKKQVWKFILGQE